MTVRANANTTKTPSSLRLSADQREELERLAALHRRSVANEIRYALDLYLSWHRGQPSPGHSVAVEP